MFEPCSRCAEVVKDTLVDTAGEQPSEHASTLRVAALAPLLVLFQLYVATQLVLFTEVHQVASEREPLRDKSN